MSCGPYAIIFVTPFCFDTKAVNFATGRHGYGHVALWAGQMTNVPLTGPGSNAEFEPIILDSSIGIGVSFRPLLEMTRGVGYRKHWLSDELGQWVFARALDCVGAPYDYGGLLARRVTDEAYTCSGLICCALPEHIARACRPRGRPVAPNDLARYFGVPKWVP
jgi:hypothetical protein